MDINLTCSCGAVKGTAINITPKNGTRVICCCDDCQAFANYLGAEEKILDAFGGTDIYQTSQSQIKINKGAEHLRCIQLTSKGLMRWYTGCCNTPVGNTMNASIPFIGIIHNFIDVQSNRDNTLGPVSAYVQTQYARGCPTYPHSAKKFPIGITFKIIQKIIIWRIKGMNKPSAFFNEKGQPIAKANTLA